MHRILVHAPLTTPPVAFIDGRLCKPHDEQAADLVAGWRLSPKRTEHEVIQARRFLMAAGRRV